jgi:hypothetical protein
MLVSNNATITVTVNACPDDQLEVSQPAICKGATAQIVVKASEAAVKYTLRRASDNLPVAYQYGNGGDLTFSVMPGSSTSYNILAENQYCSRELAIKPTIVVNELPTVTMGAFAQICDNTPMVEMPEVMPQGGVFSGEGLIKGKFYPSIVGAGIYPISYTYTDATTGCASTVVQNVEVLAKPVAAIEPFSPICSNIAPFKLTAGSPEGGVYSGDGIDSNTSIFNPAAAGVGIHQITYTVSNGVCSSSASVMVIVNPVPEVSFAAIEDQCINSPAYKFTQSTGVHTGDGVVGNFFYPKVAGVGTHTLRYDFTDAVTGCSASQTREVFVHALPVVNFEADKTVCVNAGNVDLTTMVDKQGGVFG